MSIKCKTRLHEEGFTLVELLVVVAIIGIIAAIAVPSLMSAKQSANEASAIANLKSIGVAEHQNLSFRGKYDTLANLAANGYLDSSWGTPAGLEREGYTYATVGVTSAVFSITATRTDPTTVGRDFRIKQNTFGVVDITDPANPIPIGIGQ